MMSANAAVMESDDLAGVAMDALMREARLWVVRSQQEITGRAGQLVSLLSLGDSPAASTLPVCGGRCAAGRS